jgi:glycosyltransferase involved in cell wall biosynthesis
MFVENEYPLDPRVKSEADTLTGAGYSVIVVSLKGKYETAFSKSVDAVQVYQFPRVTLFDKAHGDDAAGLVRLWLKSAAFIGYMWEYAYFTTTCLFLSLYIAIKHGFDVIHAHNPPDTIFLIAALFKPFGKKFVFDHHDLCPELYRSRYCADEGLQSKLLGLLEKGSLRLADVTIATNESYRAIHMGRGGVKPENAFVVRNAPDLRRVACRHPSERLRMMNKNIL